MSCLISFHEFTISFLLLTELALFPGFLIFFLTLKYTIPYIKQEKVCIIYLLHFLKSFIKV